MSEVATREDDNKCIFLAVLPLTSGVYRLETSWWKFNVSSRIRIRISEDPPFKIQMLWYVGGDHKTPATKIKRLVFSSEGELLSYEKRDDVGMALIYFKESIYVDDIDRKAAIEAVNLFIDELMKSIEVHGIPAKE